MISRGSVGKLTWKKGRGATDSVLTVSNQPMKGEHPYPNTIIFFPNEDYPLDTMEPHEGELVITT